MIASVGRSAWQAAGARPGFIITSIIGEGGRIRISDAENLIEELVH